MALYHDYRPTRFKDLIGQSQAVSTLSKYIKNGNLPQAVLLTGATGCLRGDAEIFDPVDGTTKSLEYRWREGIPFHVLSFSSLGNVVIGVAMPPVRYAPDYLYRVETDRSVFYARGSHSLLSLDGVYLKVGEIFSQREYASCRLRTTAALFPSVPPPSEFRYPKTELDFQASCRHESHFCDGQPLSVLEFDQGFFPLSDGVPEHTHHDWREGGSDYGSEHSQSYRWFVHPSKNHFSHRGMHESGGVCAFVAEPLRSHSYSRRTDRPGRLQKTPEDKYGTLAHPASWRVGAGDPLGHVSGFVDRRLLAWDSPVVDQVVTSCSIQEITPSVKDVYYDFHVPVYHNYLMGGVFHHNCGKSSSAFILKEKLNVADRDFIKVNCALTDGAVDLVRDIRSRMTLAATVKDGKRIWFFEEIQSWSRAGFAQQALLDMLENPPKHVHFLMATTDPDKLLAAVRNRCTEIRFRPLTPVELVQVVNSVCEQEKVKNQRRPVSPAVAQLIAEVADGAARGALNILDKVIDLETEEQQIAAIRAADVKHAAIEIARMLMNPSTKWADMAPVLKEMNEEPESMRHLILNYSMSVVLSDGKLAPRAMSLINRFSFNFYDSKKAGFVAVCYDALHSK